jgi:hypothetical protein
MRCGAKESSMKVKIYLGPYVRCVHRRSEKVVDVRSCTNERCDLHGREASYRLKFCSECGRPIGYVSKKVPDRLHPREVVGGRVSDDVFLVLGEDVLRKNEFYLGVSESDARAHRGFHFGDDDVHEDLSDVPRGEDVAWFERSYAEPLAKLRDAYDVEVRWGLHVYPEDPF